VTDHPYRNSAIMCAALALVVVALAAATGGSLLRAAGVAAAFFVLATAWTWWRVKSKLGADGRKR
jgi:hypothetical protein